MQDISFDYDEDGFAELIKALEAAEKRFPSAAETVLKEEAKEIAKDLKAQVKQEAKGHNWKSKRKRKDGGSVKLMNSFNAGKVRKVGAHYTNAVTSSAPHYHLYEEGHDLYTHLRKNKSGRGKPGSYRKIGEVAGRKTVARYMANRADQVGEIGERLLNEVLKEAESYMGGGG